MCLSAPVSFAAAAVLIPLGAATMRRAWTSDRRYLAVAALPALLGVQQLIEGLIWIEGAHANRPNVEILSLAYTFFAWIVWPVWIPLSAYFVEPPRRQPAYLIFIIVGAMLGSIQWLPYLAHTGWLKVRFLDYAVQYSDQQLLDVIVGRPLTYAVYSGLVIVPMLLSSDRRLRAFGGLIAAVLAVTLAFFQWAYISVFCFGGAVASLYLAWMIWKTPTGPAIGVPATR